MCTTKTVTDTGPLEDNSLYTNLQELHIIMLVECSRHSADKEKERTEP